MHEGRSIRGRARRREEDAAAWASYAAAHVSPAVLSARDEDGRAAVLYAPPRAQPAFHDRAQVALDATLVVDPAGTIRLFLLPDTAHFDPTFAAVRAELDAYVGAPAEPTAAAVELSSEPASGELLRG